MIIDAAHAYRRARPGFTLAEAVMALVLLGIAAAGVLLPFGDGAAAQAEGWHRTLAAKLANDLLERIARTPFEQVLVQWNGYAEAQGQVKDASGAVFTDPLYAGFRREVACYAAYVPQQTMSGSAGIAPNFVLVTVQVYYRNTLIAGIHRLISG